MKVKSLSIVLYSLCIAGCCCCGGALDSPARSTRPISTSRPTPTLEPPPPDETPEEKTSREEREKAEAEARAEQERVAAERKAKEESEGDEIEARVMAEDFVKRHLKFPDNATFHWGKQTGKTAEIFGKRHWVVEGKVDARNAFGADLTYRYKAQIFHHDGKWYPRAIIIGDEQQFFMPDEMVQEVYAPEMVIAAVSASSGSDSREPAKPERPRREPPKPKTFDVRTWRSGDSTVEATFVKFAIGQVTIKRSDNGKEVTIALDRLSEADQAYAKSLR